MNYIKHLTGFFDRVIKDDRLNPTHISLYIALFQFWNINRFVNPISIARSEVMRISKLSSKATYHKCMKELHLHGYLIYDPSYNPFRGSLVHLINFENVGKQKGRSPTKKRTGTKQAIDKQQAGIEQAVIPYKNNTNFINVTNIGTNQKNKKEGSHTGGQKEKLREKNKVKPISYSTTSFTKIPVPPSLPQVQLYFDEKDYPPIEALKFFNYYKSNGWLIGGKSPMKDWKAASRGWILNIDKFRNQQQNKPTAKHLHVPTAKNYSEPL
jgi:hypothetical protein